MSNFKLSAFADEYAAPFEEQLRALRRFGIENIVYLFSTLRREDFIFQFFNSLFISFFATKGFYKLHRTA